MLKKINGNKISYRGSNSKYINAYPLKSGGIDFVYADTIDDNSLYSFYNFGYLIVPKTIRKAMRIGETVNLYETHEGALVETKVSDVLFDPYDLVPDCDCKIKRAKLTNHERYDIVDLEKDLKLNPKWDRIRVEVSTDKGMFIRFTPDNSYQTVHYEDVREFYGYRLKNYPRRNACFSIKNASEFKVPVFFTELIGKHNLVMWKNEKEVILTVDEMTNELGYINPIETRTKPVFIVR